MSTVSTYVYTLQDSAGNTPLHLACQQDSQTLIEVFLSDPRTDTDLANFVSAVTPEKVAVYADYSLIA